jgi:phosphohistidine phosphatase
MKRSLILIRHTKSNWTDFSLPDFDRPIKKDRIDDAKNMAAQLKSLGVEPDLIICSPAKRTRQTAEYFCDKLKYEEKDIQFDKRIYESTAEDVLQVVRETDSKVKTLVVIGHNPSLTNLANMFAENSIEEIPTTGVVWLEFSIKDWELYKLTPCNLKAFLTPKTI